LPPRAGHPVDVALRGRGAERSRHLLRPGRVRLHRDSRARSTALRHAPSPRRSGRRRAPRFRRSPPRCRLACASTRARHWAKRRAARLPARVPRRSPRGPRRDYPRATQPQPGGGGRTDPLQLAARFGQSYRLIQQRPHVGSPRLARTSPSTDSAYTRGTGKVR
jgi:hypothetical protein